MLLLVADLDKFKSNNQHAQQMVAVDTGIACENINIYCASVGLATVPRGTMDHDAIRKLLNLNDNQIPLINNPVGYPAKKDATNLPSLQGQPLRIRGRMPTLRNAGGNGHLPRTLRRGKTLGAPQIDVLRERDIGRWHIRPTLRIRARHGRGRLTPLATNHRK